MDFSGTALTNLSIIYYLWEGQGRGENEGFFKLFEYYIMPGNKFR